jgi:hypothetical protein
MGNLEQPLTSDTGSSKCGSPPRANCFAFRAPPSYARHLKDAGFQLLNTANNHSKDYGLQGYRNTVAALEDAGLRVLRDTGLDWGAKVGVLTVLSAYVRSSAQMSQEFAAGRSGTGRNQTEVERDYGRALARLVDEERFPEASRLFASDLFERMPEPVAATSPVVDPDFDFGLELILAGVAAAVAASG